MKMSSSEESMSEGSNTMDGSPNSYADSLYNSPVQQVPELANGRVQYDNGPKLIILEQPQDHFRFRYRSEMVGTHGCLLGRNNSSGKTKTHPTVELINYPAKAIVRCTLAQIRNEAEHPHQLLEDDQEQDISAEVSPEKGYVVKFKNMGIIHTAKKDISAWLYQKYMKHYADKETDSKRIRSLCELEAKNINLNIVRLKFAAYDIFGKLLCKPVFSEAIHNMKSAATNELKICRMSRVTGRVKGGEDVFIFVEKVNKKNIKIRFTELDADGHEVWVDEGIFTQNDVHHQYGIMFRTPQYKNVLTPVDVKVYIQLYRPTDGKCSKSMEFVYRADPVHRRSKKRKANSYSSLESNSSASIKSVSDLPIPVSYDQQEEMYVDEKLNNNMLNFNKATVNLSFIPQQASQSELAEALYDTNLVSPANVYASPVMAQQVNSLENVSEAIQFDQMLVDTKLASDDVRAFLENFSSEPLRAEYFNSQNMQDQETMTTSFELFKSSFNIVSDSAGKKTLADSSAEDDLNLSPLDNTKGAYNAVFSKEDGLEIKKLVTEVCDMIRDKKRNKSSEVKANLNKLFDIRLNNGDTFLHMAICTNILPKMTFLIKLINNFDLTHLLNLGNNNAETILHLAIKNDMANHLDFLIDKGCNPMSEDNNGNTVIHYAVIYQHGLEELLAITKKYNVPCDLNAYNCDKQTALHIAANDGYTEGCKLLLEVGCDHNTRDSSGRTALHLAAYDQRIDVIRVIVERIPAREIDVTDGCGNTALQIVCGVNQKQHSKDIAKILLARGADLQKCEVNNESAWQLSHDKPELRALLKNYLPSGFSDSPPIKSEDEYESADEEITKMEFSQA